MADYKAGWLITATIAQMTDLVATAVPSTAVFLDGSAYTQAGVRYGTSEAVATGDVWFNGRRHRQDGAVRITTTTDASDIWLDGARLTANGRTVIVDGGSAASDVVTNGLLFTETGVLRVNLV